MKKRALLIDDTWLPSWIPNGVDPITRWPINFSDEEVEIARNTEDGLKALTENGPWHLLLLDHDLGEEKTGYDVLTFLEENTHYLPPVIYLVTSNPVGGKRMLQILISLKEKGLIRSYGWIHASGGTP